jgi:hypothetical protein
MAFCAIHARQGSWLARAVGALGFALGLLAAQSSHADIVAVAEKSTALCAAPALSVPYLTPADPAADSLAGLAKVSEPVPPSCVAADTRDVLVPLNIQGVADPLSCDPTHPSPQPLAGAGQDSAARSEIALPASPGSLTVALSSLLTLGGWRLARQARLVHLVCLPEWYHEGAPAQIGHAIAFDTGGSLHVLSVCWYQPDGLVVSRHPMAHYSRPERCAPWDSLYCIPTAAPRAPPDLS